MPIDIGSPLEELISCDPREISERFSECLSDLRHKLAAQRVAAKDGLPTISADLDEDQQSVVASRDSTLRLLAPAGAGKTHCIVNKLLALTREGFHPSRLLVVTFDRSSASELHSRARRLFDGTSEPHISTLNAFGNSVLRKYRWNGNPPRLISEFPAIQHKLLKDLLNKVGSLDPRVRAVLPEGIKRRYYLDVFSYLKNQVYSPRSAAGKDSYKRLASALAPIWNTSAAPLLARAAGDEQQLLFLLGSIDWLFRRYDGSKEQNGFIDFDDQKLLSYELFEAQPGILEAVQRAYDYVVVDEFQDLNELDFRLIVRVAGRAHLMVVGDDDQSIYGFRGTSPGYIIRLQELSGRPTTTVRLRKNYRCPRNIVRHATALIRHNSYRLEKDPIAQQASDCDIRIYSAQTPAAEASLIGDFINRLMDGRSGARLSDFAILYRMNAQSLPIQLELIQRGIPYYCRKDDNLLGQEYLPTLISILRYVSTCQQGLPPQIEDFCMTVRGYFRYLKAEDLGRLREAARRTGPPFYDCLIDPRLVGEKIGASNALKAVRELLGVVRPLEVLAVIGKRFKGVRGLVGSLEEAVEDSVPLGELGDVALRFESTGDFAAFLADAIAKAQATAVDDYQSESVKLLTYFRAKGLQFAHVILPSANDGVIPHRRAPLEDERRLFYVAVTRTQQNLLISYVKRVCNQAVEVSRFVKELDLPATCWS